ncbi:S-Ena type endospore appendage [Bacillus sp. FJAT-50079]|uniref:S-Ena type endospore appendage n=1 Tax=Bacillus sp. FJAT-50079 TaxID=2833577 RepID=UPI001BC91B82|nr:S-Ena type endospore appendage [Bacillus sp. FJAT-50079]MBS4207048.1 DUF3992 domain-containing protein [Bacillus sp. FJAT-50079]
MRKKKRRCYHSKDHSFYEDDCWGEHNEKEKPPLKEKMQTQLNCCWELNKKDVERVIFTGPSERNLTAFGTIKFECSSSQPHGLLLVKFFKGPPEKECLIDCFFIDEGSCSSFVLSNFNTITITLKKGNTPAQGELCINPIFDIC